MIKLKSYLTNDDEYTDGVLEVIESMSYGIKDVAGDTGVDQKLIDEFVKDPEFIDEVNKRKKEIKKRMKEGIKFIQIATGGKKNRWMGSDLKCELSYAFTKETKNQRILALKMYLKEIKKAVFKEFKYCEENRQKK